MKFLILLASIVSADACVVLVNPFGSFGGGVSYFFSERFDGAGYQITWAEVGSGTIDEDYATSPAPLEGTQSLRMVGAVQSPRTISTFSADTTELWAFFKIHFIALPSATRQIFMIRDGAAAIAGAVNFLADGTISARNGSTSGTAAVTALSTGTTYNFWVHWKKGTGANGITQVGFSTTTTEVTSGNQFSQTVAGNAIVDAHDLQLGFASNTTGEFIIDQILISTTGTIGNNP